MATETENNSEISVNLEQYRDRTPNSCHKYMRGIGDRFSSLLESLFYKLGYTVAKHPWKTIIISIFVCLLAAVGLTQFRINNNEADLWVPRHNRIQREKHWVDMMFPTQTRYASMIVVSDNVLMPSVLNAMYDIYEQAAHIEADGKNLSSLCVKVSSFCHTISILEFWFYNETLIRQLTRGDILTMVNSVTKSSMFNSDLSTVLGKITRNSRGYIIGAESASLTWILQNTSTVEEWELGVINIAKSGHKDLLDVFVYTTRSFDEEIYGAVNSDITLLSAGFSLVFIYLVTTLGKFNMVEHGVYISLVGLLSVGLSIAFTYGLALGIGIQYGPIHAIMPFLLLGLGVDDMFVIVGAWNNLHPDKNTQTLEEKVALALKHAGVSITITSFTDIVAFGIGASTKAYWCIYNKKSIADIIAFGVGASAVSIKYAGVSITITSTTLGFDISASTVIPALSAFCLYAAIGVFALYALQSTFFVACLTLDQKRVISNRDGCILCYKHQKSESKRCHRLEILPFLFENVIGALLGKLPIKVIVILATAILFGVNTWSFIQLKQNFDLTNYIPRDSYAHRFRKAKEEYFPTNGVEVSIYCGEIDYFRSREELETMFHKIANDRYTLRGSVKSWYVDYMEWLNGSIIFSNLEFTNNLKKFLTVKNIYQTNVKFKREKPHIIEASSMSLQHTYQPNSASEIRAMSELRNIVDETVFPYGRKCFVYSPVYLTYETNKILQGELYRNLALAAGCVFLVTLLLIANIWTCILVFICVVFTVVDVAGTLQFLGVTIDTASSILLILTVGLAVDYSAHVGHTFMTILDTRQGRVISTLRTIGPAVFNGGFSTFLAFLLLSNSNSYGFVLFFRVFSTVVLFGLYHGLIFLPVMLSLVGPSPYWASPSVQQRKDDGQNIIHTDGRIPEGQEDSMKQLL